MHGAGRFNVNFRHVEILGNNTICITRILTSAFWAIRDGFILLGTTATPL